MIKTYLQKLVECIKVDGDHVTIVGKVGGATGMLGGGNDAGEPRACKPGVRTSVTVWLRRRDSNPRPDG